MATADLITADKKGKPGGGRLQCVVVTPERTLFDDLVDFVALPLLDGELGVARGRAPLIGRLGYGELRTKADGATRRYFVDGGFVQVRDDVVTVLTNRATPAESLDAAAATVELSEARALKTSNAAELDAKTKAVARARAKVRVASRGRV